MSVTHELTEGQLEAVTWELHELIDRVSSISEIVAHRYHTTKHKDITEDVFMLEAVYGERVAEILMATDDELAKMGYLEE